MLNILRRTYAWLTLADYDEASKAATEQVMKRYARGNTSLQNGWYLDERDLTTLSKKGDIAAAHLSQRVS